MTELQAQQRLLFLEGAIKRVLLSSGLPLGGSTGQVLAKASAADGDVAWIDMGISPDGTFTICDGTIDVTGSIVGAFFELTEGSP